MKSSEGPVEWIEAGADDVEAFKTSVAGLEALVIFRFFDDQLARGQSGVTEQHTNDTAFLTDYRKLAGLLEQKYGAPKEDETLWLNDLYKGDPANWGMAVSVGHLTKFKTWATDDTDIYLMLTGDNFDVSLHLEYASQKYSALADKQQEAETLDAL